MIKQGYHPEKGLEKYIQEIQKPLMLKEVKYRYGLGYIPTVADRRKKAKEKKMRRVERITGETSSKEGLYISSISQTFVKGNQSNLEAELWQLSISVLDAEVLSSTSTEWIRHLQPRVQLQNWSSFDLPDIIMKAIKGSVIAEYLAERAVEDYQPMEFEFPDQDIDSLTQGEEDLEEWRMLFDGAINAWGHGIGAVLISPDGKHYPVTALYRGVKRLTVRGDSALVIHQLTGEWETRDSKLVLYREYIQKMIEGFDSISFSHTPRENNVMSDALATLAALFKVEEGVKIETIQIRVQPEPAHYTVIEEADGKQWFYDIKTYIQKNEYLEGAAINDQRTIRRLAMGFFSDGEVLYKRNHDMTLLRCVEAHEARQAMHEVHKGVCGTYAGGHSLARKVLRSGYYWMTMERDCIDYARKCHKCQVYDDRIQVPPAPLHVLSAPWPFSTWGMDVIGPISPKASNGHRFIFVAINYFTKWVEAASYSSVTQNVVSRFVKRGLICRYKIPERIIIDNAKNLNNAIITKLCNQFKVKHHNSAS
ncbi:uncharacterized protein LOC131143849 [Malania oleifera]|uniref:uncharacterized protein LOC131143849 n=1 Tax=Malania oleifera TaxID=397392 RepID=UPI0025AEA74E|nr:uncharacterized protein LOC131143849 [Malania oleifera]